MRPIVPAPAAFFLLAGLRATVFVLMQPAPVAPPASWVVYAGDPGNPCVNAASDRIVQTAIEDGLAEARGGRRR